MITADHKVLNERQESRMHQQYAVVVQDLVTPWIPSCPCKTKLQRSLRTFLRPGENPRSIFTVISLEFMTTCEELNWKHEGSTPRRSEKMDLQKRAVRRVKEGTSSVLVQSGLQESWWAEAMECYERRFNSPFDGPIIPFRADVKFSPKCMSTR